MKFSETTFAAIAAATGLGATTAGAACCVLPLMLAGVGVGAGALTPMVPFHWPLSVIALVAVATGWFLYLRRRRACAVGVDCAPPSKTTFLLLIVASLLVVIAAAWPFIEAPLTKVVGT
ncbi:mercuric ion transport protein [Sphingomonas kaistensis]|uniref:Mercuric ion transport protein n=1 Tax=Sphingomonas kaistensis TaxID=298708 RepID=A0A7X6BGJ6_9SPHN|nr:hypothetical protein [Sphingomonas kaistensis]NJC05151.1 mercuric ion transport protein [Sphingomonas kaistensis]